MAILLAILHIAPFFNVQYIGNYASIELSVMCGNEYPTNGDKYLSS